MSPNVAKWIVYEKMKEPRFVFIFHSFWLVGGRRRALMGSWVYENGCSDEADLKQRQKLSKLVTEKYGPTNQNENVELIPEDISGRFSDSWFARTLRYLTGSVSSSQHQYKTIVRNWYSRISWTMPWDWYRLG